MIVFASAVTFLIVFNCIGYWRHAKTHMFVLHCPFCRHDKKRLTLMYHMLSEKQPEDIPQWVGVYRESQPNEGAATDGNTISTSE